jgi:hypothetical protein
MPGSTLKLTRHEHDNTRYHESYVGILPYAVQGLRTEVQLRGSIILSSIPSHYGLRVSRLEPLAGIKEERSLP